MTCFFACTFNCYTEIRYSAKSYPLGICCLAFKDKCVTISMTGAKSLLRALLSLPTHRHAAPIPPLYLHRRFALRRAFQVTSLWS